MRLYLSTRKPWNSVYTTEDGQVVYRTTTPWFERRTSIERIVPNQDKGDMRDEFAHLAEVDYRVCIFLSSHIRYAGQDLVTRDFFRKGSWSWQGRSVISTGRDYQYVTDSNRGRIFTGPDGIEYKWKFGAHIRAEVRRFFCYSSPTQARVSWIAPFE
jgi:hypothetical protein